MQVSETDLQTFLQNKVNLPQDKVTAYRQQVNNLRTKLESYINENPEFELVKMLHSGSVAKGTALSDINDMDVAVYVKPDAIADHEVHYVLDYVRQALVNAYSGSMSPEQFTLGTHCIRVSFKGSGLDVDVVPVIPNGQPDDRGDILNRETGAWLETSIPLHLAFIRARKTNYSRCAELIRMTKWWRNQREFKHKSFLIELIWCYLVDSQDLPESRIDALAKYLTYILRTKLDEQIVFSDYYKLSEIESNNDAVRIFDPVNPKNNVGGRMTKQEKEKIIEECQLAFDALSMARSAFTKGNAVAQWQRILGTSFNP